MIYIIFVRFRFIPRSNIYRWMLLVLPASPREAWMLSDGMEKKLQAFEMWIFRRILRISWIEIITNEEVLRRIGCEPEIILTVKRRKLECFGHIM